MSGKRLKISSRNMHNPLVSIIIVNWNGMRFLDNCLGSLSKVKYKNTEILFVDNASVDDSIQFVRKKFPSIKILQNKENLGYAGGHEKAFKIAKGKLILLLSTDTIVEPNLLDELVGAISSKENIGAVMPKLLMYPKKNLIDSIGSFFLSSGIIYHMGRDKDQAEPQYNKPMDVFSGKGACMLFKKSVLDKTGLFDKDYFAYFEETDLCHRIWLSGNKVIYWPKTSVCHMQGGSSKQMVPSFILYHSYKNILCTYIKNLSLKYLIRVLPLTLVIYQCGFLIFLFTGKFKTAWAFQKSIIWNINNLPATLKKRKIVQNKIRTVSDDYFLPKVTRHVSLRYYYYLFTGEGLAKYYD